MADSTWQYRLMRRVRGKTTLHYWYDVVEAYREDGQIAHWTVRGVGPCGETPEIARADYDMMAEAFALPVLDEAELLAAIKGRRKQTEWVTQAHNNPVVHSNGG